MKKRSIKRSKAFFWKPQKHPTGTLWLWWHFGKPANKWDFS